MEKKEQKAAAGHPLDPQHKLETETIVAKHELERSDLSAKQAKERKERDAADAE